MVPRQDGTWFWAVDADKRIAALEAEVERLTDKQCDHLNTKGALQSTQDHNAKLRAEVERLLGVVDAALEFRACYIGISPNSFITQPGVKYAEVIKKWKALVAALKEATDE